MTLIPENYPELVYAGWLGKIIGVRHGANVEGWTYERIKKTFGEIDYYPHDFKNFAADDDINGPVYFLRAIDDYTHTRDITAEEMGLNMLNYVPDNHAFFWWGGYGKSTENTAYMNLKNGIMPPRSGSIAQNGATVAEQIGGQIFIDIWGLIAPNQPKLASEYAEKMASVTHGGNGKYGGMFIAACVASAFSEDNIEKVIEDGLSVIPSDCEYAEMTKDVIDFYKNNPENWRDCFNYVYNNYGYDKYPGNCHIIPNSAVIVLSLLYSQGDFSRAINISNMCGWDTDCNVGNVGAITGVFNGLEGIDWSWREPINDFLCNSGVIGSLNIMDIPSLSLYTADLGYKVVEEKPSGKWEKLLGEDRAQYHFELPDSTQSFRVDTDEEGVQGQVDNTSEVAYKGDHALKVFFDKAQTGFGYRSYLKTYYTPEDFDDSRYDPAFSPIIYPGQKIESRVKLSDYGFENVKARLYIKDRNSGKKYYGNKIELNSEDWKHIEYRIPALKSVCIEEAGIELIPYHGGTRGYSDSLVVYLDEFDFSGKPDYEIKFEEETLEEWTRLHVEVSQLTYLRGIWTLENGELSGSFSGGEPAEAYTGDLKWENYIYETELIPKLGQFHNINFRVQGAIRSYAAGFAENDKFVLYKNKNGYEVLKEVDYSWSFNKSYNIRVESQDNHFQVYIDDQKVIDYTDEDNPYLNGQIGFSNFKGSRTHYKSFKVKGI